MRIVTQRKGYFVQTGKYFLRHGAAIALINLVPCALLPFLPSLSGTLYTLFAVKDIDVPSLNMLFATAHSVPFSFWYIGFIGLAALLVTVAVTFGAIDRHMRVGDFTLSPSRVFNRLNYNILTAVRFVVMTFCILEVGEITTVMLFYLWLSALKSYAARLVFCIASFVFTHALILLTLAIVILWPPFMLHAGLRAADAFKMGWRMMSGKTPAAALSLFAAMSPVLAVMVVTGALHMGVVCRLALDIILYAVMLTYYICLMYNIYYDVTGTERMDLVPKEKSIWKK